MTQKNGSATLRDARRIVVKVGSSLVTNEGRGLDEGAIGEWSRQLAALAGDGRLVCSHGGCQRPFLPRPVRVVIHRLPPGSSDSSTILCATSAAFTS